MLSDFFDRVTVLDRDSFPEGVEDRAGVPQARHVHGLLVRGLWEYERAFPASSISRSRRARRFTTIPGISSCCGRRDGSRVPSDLKFLSASRELIESCVRDLFRRLPKVELRERVAVTGLKVSRDGGRPRCVGVTVPADQRGSAAVNKDDKRGRKAGMIEADLIVDASGAVSRAPAWLEAAGLKPPRESVVDPLAGYSSRWFKGPPPGQWPEQWWWWAGAYIRRRPDDLTEANFQLKEHNRWHLTLSGFNRRYPPTHEAEFMEALKRMRSPIIDEMTRLMEPISPVYANRAMRNHWRHYERWNERLDGFIAIGDAFCHYNPVYAQGMTALALSATMLRACLGNTHRRRRSSHASFSTPRRGFSATRGNCRPASICAFHSRLASGRSR